MTVTKKLPFLRANPSFPICCWFVGVSFMTDLHLNTHFICSVAHAAFFPLFVCALVRTAACLFWLRPESLLLSLSVSTADFFAACNVSGIFLLPSDDIIKLAWSCLFLAVCACFASGQPACLYWHAESQFQVCLCLCWKVEDVRINSDLSFNIMGYKNDD